MLSGGLEASDCEQWMTKCVGSGWLMASCGVVFGERWEDAEMGGEAFGEGGGEQRCGR